MLYVYTYDWVNKITTLGLIPKLWLRSQTMNWTSHSHNFLKMRSSNGDFTIGFICTRVLVSCSRANFIISFIFFIFLHQEEQNMYVNTAKRLYIQGCLWPHPKILAANCYSTEKKLEAIYGVPSALPWQSKTQNTQTNYTLYLTNCIDDNRSIYMHRTLASWW